MKGKPKDIESKPVEKRLPIAKFRSGALQASIWSNENEKNGEKFENFSFNIERGYIDKEDKWQTTTSFRKRDVANIQALIARISEYLYIDEDPEKTE